MSIPLPRQPASENERQLASRLRERLTGATVTVVPLQQSAIAGHEHVYKNGLLLDPGADYTIIGNVLTLQTPLVVSDVLVTHYHYRATQ